MKDIPRPYSPDMRAAGTVGDAGKPARVTSPEQIGLTHTPDLPHVSGISQLDDKTGPNASPFAGRSAAITPPRRFPEVVMPWQRGDRPHVSASAVPSSDERKPVDPVASGDDVYQTEQRHAAYVRADSGGHADITVRSEAARPEDRGGEELPQTQKAGETAQNPSYQAPTPVNVWNEPTDQYSGAQPQRAQAQAREEGGAARQQTDASASDDPKVASRAEEDVPKTAGAIPPKPPGGERILGGEAGDDHMDFTTAIRRRGDSKISGTGDNQQAGKTTEGKQAQKKATEQAGSETAHTASAEGNGPGKGGKPTVDGEAGDSEHHIYFNAAGIKVGEERSETYMGAERVMYFTYDTAGSDVSYPALSRGAIIEGVDQLLGDAYYTVERDEQGRPLRVIGFKLRDGYEQYMKQLAQQFSGSAEEDTTVSTDGQKEVVFSYNADGLLTKVVETEEEEDTVKRFQHENFYEASGRRIGYVGKRRENVSPTDEEEYTVFQVSLFEYDPERCREIEYKQFRGGLRPLRIVEYEIGKTPTIFDPESVEYHADVIYANELVPYFLAVNPLTTELHEAHRGKGTRRPSITVPSWIPKGAAYDVANHTISIEDAATIPLFPETLGKQVISLDEAFSEIVGYETSEEVSRFINRLTMQEAFVVFSPAQLSRIVKPMTEVRGSTDALSLTQKFALVGALHPLFSREEFVPDDSLTVWGDAQNLKILRETLNVSLDEIAERVEQLGDYLNWESLRRFEYLLELPENTV